MKRCFLKVFLLGVMLITLHGISLSAQKDYTEIVLDRTDASLARVQSDQVVELPSTGMLVIKLTAIPSSGYQWQVLQPSTKDALVEEVNGTFSTQKVPEYVQEQGLMPGSPRTQIIRLVGTGEGNVRIMLGYRRPWQAGHLKAMKINVHAQGKFIGTIATPQQASEYTPPPLSEIYAAGLPAHFDWREQNGVTPVKNQGGCGSCWAFGASAAFEAKLLIKDGVTRDLAEQYLVSCNNMGFSCAGGWWAHDYFWYESLPSELGGGARYEADFPYQAGDVQCNPPHTPNEQIEGWGYTDDVPDNPSPTQAHRPTVAQIKEKIYNYGPVATEVCSSSFGSYTGGVWKTSCESGDHIVLITGWDDTDGCFYVKNSWGSDWGENGYIRLAYGVCLVGSNSTYLLYEKTNPRLVYRTLSFAEGRYNDGSIGNTIEARIEDSTSNTRFVVTSGTMTQGTHYTVANLPAGLSLTIQSSSSTRCVLKLNGQALTHLKANDVSNVTVTFLNAAFTGNSASDVEGASFNGLKINFNDPYQFIYANPADITISPTNVWNYYSAEGSNGAIGFGVWWYDSANESNPANNKTLKYESYGKPVISHGTALPPNAKALNYGDVIGPNSQIWAAGGTYGEQHTLAGSAYNDFKGQIKYIGVVWPYNGYECYGWVRIQVSADGTQATLLDYAWDQNPNNSVFAGQTTSSNCTYAISPISASYSGSGSTGSVNITTQTNCTWTASSNVSWITVTSGTSGSGNGTTSYSVAANSGTSARTGTITIAQNTFTVSQSGSGASAPTITTQPVNKTVAVGQTATFTVTATGTAPLTYQWYKNNTEINGASSATYTTPVTTSSDNGARFYVRVSNAAGYVDSNTVTLTVTSNSETALTNNVAITVSGVQGSQTVYYIEVPSGSTNLVMALSGGTGDADMYTRFGSVPTTSSYDCRPYKTGNAETCTVATPIAGRYYIMLYGYAAYSGASLKASFTVSTNVPTITTQPVNKTVAAGQTATFSVTATGTAPLTYQWYTNGTAINGATAATYTTPVTTSADNGATFYVKVSNANGYVNSNTVTLTVTSGSLSINLQVSTAVGSATCNPNTTGAVSVVYWVDQQSPVTVTTSPFTYVINTTSMTKGSTHNVYARATNSVGQYVDSGWVSFVVK